MGNCAFAEKIKKIHRTLKVYFTMFVFIKFDTIMTKVGQLFIPGHKYR